MAIHSSILVWRISWTEKSGGLQPMRLQRVGHNWVTALSVVELGPHSPQGSQPAIRHRVCIRAWPFLLTVLCSLLISAQCSLSLSLSPGTFHWANCNFGGSVCIMVWDSLSPIFLPTFFSFSYQICINTRKLYLPIRVSFPCIFHRYCAFVQIHLFSQIIVRLPQTAILVFCISFPWRWIALKRGEAKSKGEKER